MFNSFCGDNQAFYVDFNVVLVVLVFSMIFNIALAALQASFLWTTATLAEVYPPLESIKPRSNVVSDRIKLAADLYPAYFFYFHHIPKTGGTHFQHRIAGFGRNCGFGFYRDPKFTTVDAAYRDPTCTAVSYEMTSNNSVINTSKLTRRKPLGFVFIRNPILQFLSGFNHMKHLEKRRSSGCKSMVDYLNQSVQCDRFPLVNHQTLLLGDNITSAVERLFSFFFVGITEFYDASVCLLRYQLGQFDKARCDCRVKAATEQPTEILNALHHDAETLTHEDLTDIVLNRVYDDAVLYHKARMMFLSRVAEVEKKLDVRLICDDPSADIRFTKDFLAILGRRY